MARFGIEEEFILLDEKTLVPLALSHDQRGAIVGDAADGEITAEYLTCQLESVLRPAMTLSARVALVKRVPAGEGVSYGHAWTAETDTTLALVPIGYADGVPRRHPSDWERPSAARREHRQETNWTEEP